LLRDYRDWLASELKLLGNASHHAYAFGQANMAQRALERLDAERAATLYVGLERGAARRMLAALDVAASGGDPDLASLRSAIAAALDEE
jgi:hypothetical protein